MNPRKFKAAPQNVPGDFYVEDNCCTFCGVPQSIAPTLFNRLDEKGTLSSPISSCYVKKQPADKEEIQQMIEVIATQDLGCIRYCGNDIGIIEMIKKNEASDAID